MEKNKQLMKSFTRFQDQKVGLMLVACFLASMLFLVLSKANNDISLRILTPKSSLVAVSASLKADDDKTDSVDGGNSTDPLCDVAQPRSEFCEMDGDVRIHGNSSTVTFVSTSTARNDESYSIRPYARKGDDTAMSFIREVHVKRDFVDKLPPRCTVNHTAATPAIVFSTSAYAGNIFHDYSDILIPLFLTSRRYEGEVRFLVANINPWWLNKYRSVLGRLTKYPVIDFDKDTEVRCFSRVVVGLKCSKELSIDPSASPNGYAMPDFTRFLRASYNLTRDAVVRPGPGRPRMMIISRSRARAFTNVEEIVRLARETGFEPVVAEAGVGSDVGRFAGEVNSCDAMMGVHGAGLTNLLYLPAKATVIQVVPWGGLGWVARYDYGVPAADSGLNYLQYEIREEESSLAEVYPRDHAVFKDPFKYHKLGWMAMRKMFMDNQTVKLDINRFRPVLLEALEIVRKQQQQQQQQQQQSVAESIQ